MPWMEDLGTEEKERLRVTVDLEALEQQNAELEALRKENERLQRENSELADAIAAEHGIYVPPERP